MDICSGRASVLLLSPGELRTCPTGWSSLSDVVVGNPGVPQGPVLAPLLVTPQPGPEPRLQRSSEGSAGVGQELKHGAVGERNHLLLDVTMAEEKTGRAGGPNLETSESAREATEQTGLCQGPSVPVPSRDLPEAEWLGSSTLRRLAPC